MTDIDPERSEGSPAVEPVVIEPTPEEIERAKQLAIAENDAAVQRELKRLSRRGFLTLGGGAIATYLGWKWLRLRPKEAGVEWPLRRGFSFNEKVAEAYFSPNRMTRTFPQSALTYARINGGDGLTPNYDVSTWRLQVLGGEHDATLTLDDLKQLPKRTMITELRCIEGWSIVVKWSGVRLADLMSEVRPPSRFTRYVGMETPDRGYYVGLDMQSAKHPQTLLAYEMNDQPLTWQHGAPVRLAIPVKYGVKNIKRVGKIFYGDVRPADFWAERGYDWYLGH